MKFNEITDDLRKRIICGEFGPGTCIPRRQELVKEYRASLSALQKSINILIEENFIESKGSKGCMVTQTPPHLSCVGIVFPADSSSGISEDSLWKALFSEAKKMSCNLSGISFEFYFVGGYRTQKFQEWERFFEDVKTRRLAGAIFFSYPPEDHTELLDDFAHVQIDYKEEYSLHNPIRLATDHVALFNKSLDVLTAAGCHNIATLIQHTMNNSGVMRIMEAAHNSKVYCPIEWIQPLHYKNTNPLLAGHIIELLFSKNTSRVPDGLVVLNENFLPVVMDSLLRLNLIPGRDVQVVSHCNYPFTGKIYQDVNYVAFKAKDILEQCIALMEKFRDGDRKSIEIEHKIEPIIIR